MSVIFKYQPNAGIVFGGNSIPWNASKKNVRGALGGRFEVQTEWGLNRDIYKEIDGQPLFVFIDYDEQDRFVELEVHSGISFEVNGQTLDFDQSFGQAVHHINSISTDMVRNREGEVLFKDLKLNLCSGRVMGSDNDLLSYIYCSNNIEHLVS
jgi:hypothetical protein